MSPKGEAMVGVTKRELKGCRFDEAEIDAVLSISDVVVAHAAAFDRLFLEPLIQALTHKRWACSMTDIGWRQPEGLANASIDLLLTHHGGGASGHTLEDDCRALCFVLDQPLPKSLVPDSES